MKHIKTYLGSIALAVLLISPLAASAIGFNATTTAHVRISPSGIVHVIGASVTAVSNSVVNAATSFGSTVMNWVVNTSPDTKITVHGQANATTSAIQVGDKISFTGILSSSGNPMVVSAKKIHDPLPISLRVRSATGTVSNVNPSTGSFTLSFGNRSATIQTTASTTIMVNGTATTTFSGIANGQKATVKGVVNTDGTVMTASKVSVRNTPVISANSRENEHAGKAGEHGLHLGLFGKIHLEDR